MQRKEIYLKLRLIKQYGVTGRSVLLVLRLPRKKEKKKKKKEMNKYSYGVSHKKAP